MTVPLFPRLACLLVLLPGLLSMTNGRPVAGQTAHHHHHGAEAPYGAFRKVAVSTGPRSRLTPKKNWQGVVHPGRSVKILMLAGHADSQKMGGSGTPGYAVAIGGAAPMDPAMTDEAYWNIATAERIAKLGRQRGLNIHFYDSHVRTIRENDDPRTNWSAGKRHVAAGGYALEIHYDAYGKHGYGSGVIPRKQNQTVIDEALAREFGSFPWDFRNVLGAPKRGITMLEIGKLEGDLENKLRNPATREGTLNTLADRVVTVMANALGIPEGASLAPPPLPKLARGAAAAAASPPTPPALSDDATAE